jgi:pimeloyl-ACP methyl ester carboxylesterase
LAPRWAGDLPPEVVRDSFEHSWPAYRDALGSLFADNPLPGALAHPRVTTVVVVGEDDTEAPAADVLDHPHDRVEVRVVATDHLLPLRRPDVVQAAVAAAPLLY